MFGTDSSFMAGYIAGESADEFSKSIADGALMFTRHQRVEITQGDLNALHARIRNAEATAIDNYNNANDWMALAQSLQRDVATLKSRLRDMDSVTRERDALLKFLSVAGHVLRAHGAGKADRPEFDELRDFALDIAYKHLKGQLYEGLGDHPEKLARFSKLWDALD
ncbi:hypothetical protein SAMN06265338_13518 [Rhodoblastus acidophilus]|uniref:Uncharacterized protein n=1 Tax=Rhodoblastus acidophilus TaxID=1074 RepID=A0A212SFQ0_RHOAC|nr:hypothetical protein [Rhodoblastus acidophilus]PPQ34912.1 hypothetical protein CKO16_21545 [Rhodoblastus acidophilus]RAI16621.1 hypothetical protein CH337_20370 [Rhodoblastus acidophilus]SNB84389.1 hypothetical protein SAMN06265338_13518 [Rhodoblastus acidophilus]